LLNFEKVAFCKQPKFSRTKILAVCRGVLRVNGSATAEAALINMIF
jgi:hypothetical protein